MNIGYMKSILYAELNGRVLLTYTWIPNFWWWKLIIPVLGEKLKRNDKSCNLVSLCYICNNSHITGKLLPIALIWLSTDLSLNSC